MKILASNKKAYFNFDILDSVEAGILLKGWEVKSIKGGRMSLAGAYIKNKNGEMYLEGSIVPVWKSSPKTENEFTERVRKLLLHKKQIVELTANAKMPGNTIVPLEVIEKDGLVKVVVGLVRGRKKFDKRAKLKEKDLKKRVDSDRKRYNI